MAEAGKGAAGVRVLQIVGGLNRGGVEMWLAQSQPLLRAQGISSDFVVHSFNSWDLEDVVGDADSNIIVCERNAGVFRYAFRLWRLLRVEKYDVVHAHVGSFGLVPLLVARICGVRHRLFHSHSAFPARTLLRSLYAKAVTWCLPLAATQRLAVSRTAGVAAFGKRANFAVMAPGVDLDRFLAAGRKRTTLAASGRSQASFTIGHVGRFEPEKNQQFLLDVAAEAARRGFPWQFELVGSGRLKNELVQSARRRRLKNVSFAGASSVVHDLAAYWHLFAFPSHHEGLGLAMIEAQAAGLRCLASPYVPTEATLLDGSVASEMLDPQVWVSRIEELLALPAVDGQSLARAVESSSFQVTNAATNLARLYTSLCGAPGAGPG